MIKYLLILTMLLSGNAFAGEPNLKIELENKNNKLRLYLINYTGREIFINKRFSFVHYPSSSAPEIEFEFVNSKGRKFPFGGVLINENSYGADKGVYTGRLISNWVTYIVPETDMKNDVNKGDSK